MDAVTNLRMQLALVIHGVNDGPNGYYDPNDYLREADAAIAVFAKWLREEAEGYAGSLDAHIGITLNNMADGITGSEGF